MPDDPREVALKDHLLTLINERDRTYIERFASMEKAITKAEAASDIRLAGMNEFRTAMNDQQQTFARKAEMDIRFEALEKNMHMMKGRDSGIGIAWAVVLAGVGVLLALFWKK